MTWAGGTAGPQLGRLTIDRKDGRRHLRRHRFAPC